MATDSGDNIRSLHNRLGLALEKQLLSDDLSRIKHYFNGCGLGSRELECSKDFLELWRKLEVKKIIEPRKYSKLVDAFKVIDALAHLQVIKHFEELMKSEDGLYDGWIIDNKTVESVEELNELKGKYEALLHERHGVVFNNAVMCYVREDGEELQLRNGTAKLQVHPSTLTDDKQEMFWIFRAPADIESTLIIKPKTNSTNSIVEYSLPVRLGPTDVHFKKPVSLTLHDLSLPDFNNGSTKPMLIYRKEDGNDSPEPIGSCFCDSINLTATAQLDRFSSYVLGLPSTGHTHFLNVHLLVGYTVAGGIHVYFLINDYSYVSEFVQKQKISIVTETCLYLDTQKYLKVCVMSTGLDLLMIQDVSNDQLKGLAEFPVQIACIFRSGGSLGEVTLTLSQGGKCLLSLPVDEKLLTQRVNIVELTTASNYVATDIEPQARVVTNTKVPGKGAKDEAPFSLRPWNRELPEQRELDIDSLSLRSTKIESSYIDMRGLFENFQFCVLWSLVVGASSSKESDSKDLIPEQLDFSKLYLCDFKKSALSLLMMMEKNTKESSMMIEQSTKQEFGMYVNMLRNGAGRIRPELRSIMRSSLMSVDTNEPDNRVERIEEVFHAVLADPLFVTPRFYRRIPTYFLLVVRATEQLVEENGRDEFEELAISGIVGITRKIEAMLQRLGNLLPDESQTESNRWEVVTKLFSTDDRESVAKFGNWWLRYIEDHKKVMTKENKDKHYKELTGDELRMADNYVTQLKDAFRSPLGETPAGV